MSNRTKGILSILLGAVVGGVVSTLVKLSIKDIPPFTFSFIRFLIASICLLPFFLKAGIKFDKFFRKLIFLSLLATLNIVFFVLGIQSTTASIAQMLYAGSPLIVGLIGYFLLGHKMKLKRWIFITIGLVGVLLVIFLPLIQKNTLHTGSFIGNIFISLAVLSWSFYAVFSKEFQKKYQPLVLTAMFCFVTTIVLLPLALLEVGKNGDWWHNLKLSSILVMLYVSLFGTIGTYFLNQLAFKYANSVLGSFSLYLMPIFAYFYAYLLLGEQLTPGLILGTIIVFISIALTSYSK